MACAIKPKIVTYDQHIATLMVYFWRIHVTRHSAVSNDNVTKLTENHTLTFLDKWAQVGTK